jgi:rRNA-processing protein FCF1
MEGSLPSSKQQLLSGRLQGLKFMQRARKREEALQKQQQEEEESSVEDDSHWVAPGHNTAAASRKCVVIVEGDPKPSATLGRMSFQNFNPAVEKIVEEVEMRRQNLRQGMSTANGEMSRELSTKSQQEKESAAAAAAAAVYANDEPLRKKLKTEKIVVVKTEAATTAVMTAMPNVKQSEKIVVDRHSQQLDSKQGFQGRDQGRNQGRDWRQLRPPGREAL